MRGSDGGIKSPLTETVKQSPERPLRWTFKLVKNSFVDPNNLPQNLQFVSDLNTNVLFLIDSGSEISLLPKSLTNGINKYFLPNSKSIQGIGDSVIHPVGSADIEVNVSELGNFTHTFWITPESRGYGIIGLDFLKANELEILPAKSQLRSAISGRKTKLLVASDFPSPVVASINSVELINSGKNSLEERCKALLAKFPEITKKPDYTVPPKHNHSLEIIVDNYCPKMTKARRCGGTREVIKDHFFDLLERGAVVRGSGDTCASPVTCVPKKDKTYRVCIDYTILNSHTRPLSYPLPRIDELSEIIPGGTCVFSTLDLKEAYYSLPIEISSQKYAAIITHKGVFIPKRCTFGLKNAPTRFQQMMESIFISCQTFTFIYLDDILIFSKTEEDHISHLKTVFKILSDNGLYLNTNKCNLAKTKLDFLGHSVSIEGLNVLDSKVEAIREYPIPTTRRDLKRFLGLANYYHRFVPKIAEITAPLNELSGGPKSTNRAKINLKDRHIQAFKNTKAILAHTTTLSYEDHNKPLMLFSDASDTHVGAVLEQEGKNGEMRPLAFFSKKLPPLKTVRSTFYKELRALYLSLKHFQYRILGRRLLIRTDNKALVGAINNTLKDQSPMEQRYIMLIKEFDPEVAHIAGSNNTVADALSRPPQITAMHVRAHQEDPDYLCSSESDSSDSELDIDDFDNSEQLITPEVYDLDISSSDVESVSPKTLDREAIAIFQRREPGLIDQARLLKKEVQFTTNENMAFFIEDGIKRVILPESLRLTAYNAAHNRLHLGIEKSIEAIARTFWWPKLRNDISHWVNNCATCQQTKVSRHNRPNIGFFPNNTQRFQFLHLDLIGPLDKSVDYQYVLMIKDRATGLLVTAPIPDKTAITVRNAFIQNWVGHYGVPQVVLSDNGKEFKNFLLQEACKQLGIEQRFTSSRTPQTNGYVERQNRTINVAFRSLEDKTNWALHLPLITCTINNSFIEGSPYTPAQYAFGCSLNLSGRLLFDEVDEIHQITRPSPFECAVFVNSMADISRKFRKTKNDAPFYQPGLFNCRYVWLKKNNRKKLDKLYEGPYKVVRNKSTEHSLYIIKNSQVVKVSIGNTKAYVGPLNLTDELEGINSYNLRPHGPVNYAETHSSEE